MIKVNVISEEKSWSKKIKKKELLFDKIIKYFPNKFKFLNHLKQLFLVFQLQVRPKYNNFRPPKITINRPNTLPIAKL